MVGLINLGAGLSQMGASIAQSGQMGEQNTLDEQKMALANDLATSRETKLQGQQFAHEEATQAAEHTFQQGQQGKLFSHEETMQTAQLGSAEKIAKEQIEAAHANVMAQVSAEGWGIQFDQNSGNPIRVNNITGKAEPLVDGNGQPLQVVNTALMPVIKETVTGINQERQANIQGYNSRLNALISERQSAMNSVTAVRPEDKVKAAKPFDDQIATLKKEHDQDLSAFADRTASAIAPLYAKSQQPAPKPTAVKGPGTNIDDVLFPK